MKRILHFVPSLGIHGGGPPRSVSELCARLAEEMDIVLVSRKQNSPLVDLDPRIHTEILPPRRSRLALGSHGRDLSARLDALHAESPVAMVHQHGIWLRDSHITTRFATRRGIPLLLSPRGMLEPWSLRYHRHKKIPAWWLYQKTDLLRARAFHATARTEAENIRRLGFTQPIAVVPNGVHLPPLPPPKRQSGHQGPLQALYLSRLHPKKGIHMLLDAWATLAPKHWSLTIAGNDDGGHLPVIQDHISKLGLTASVTLAGPLYGQAKANAFRNADVFLLPSYSENFGIVVAEALAFGVPVLSTTGCPWKELVDRDCGWWVDPTPAGIEAGLRAALHSSVSTRVEMGLRGRRLVEEKYQWPAIAEKFRHFYDWLLGSDDKPDFVMD